MDQALCFAQCDPQRDCSLFLSKGGFILRAMNIGQNMAPIWLRILQLSKYGEFHRILSYMLSPLCNVLTAVVKAYDPKNNENYDIISVCYVDDESLLKFSAKVYLCYSFLDQIKCMLYEIHWGGVVRKYEFSIQGRDDVLFIESELINIKMKYLHKREKKLNLLIQELHSSQGQFNFTYANDKILQEAIFDLISASAKMKALNFTRDE